MRSNRLGTLRNANRAYSVFAFITPPIWWAHVAVALDSFAAAAPQSLIFCSKAFAAAGGAYAFYFGTFIVMGNQTTPVCVFDLEVALVAPYTVQTRRRRKGCKEVEQNCESGWVWRRQGIKVSQCVGMQSLGRNGSDEATERTGIGRERTGVGRERTGVDSERTRIGNERTGIGSERTGVGIEDVGRRGRVHRAGRRRACSQPARKKTKHMVCAHRLFSLVYTIHHVY